jgi:hypothetical protein
MNGKPFSSSLVVLVICLVCGGTAPRGHAAPAATSDSAQTSSFFKSARPYTRWWWFASDITPEDIDAQLEWLRDNKFGGVEIAWLYPPRPKVWSNLFNQLSPEEKERKFRAPKWLSPEWSALVAHAKQRADKLGLGCDFTFGSGWPFGDGGVTKEESIQIYDKPDFEQRIERISWEMPNKPLVLNHLDRRAFAHYAQRLGEALRPALAGSRSGLFCDSWEVETHGLWTRGFGEAFQKRFGYDVRPFMGQLYDRDSGDVRYDYMKFLSGYVLEEFYKPFVQSCHELGAFSRVQAHGSPTDLLTAYALFDVPESEAMLFEPPFSRIAASAAALAGRREVSAETFTCVYGFAREHHMEEQTADLKLVADAMFANGVNQIIWHGTPLSYKDAGHDSQFYATVHVGREGTLSRDLPAFNSYMEKVSSLMKRGRTCAEVAVYLPLEDAWVAGEYPKALQIPWGASDFYELRAARFPDEVKGYHPLWINNEFLKRGTVEKGRLRVGDLIFSALYVDASFLDLETLGTVFRLADAGLPICLKRTPNQAGHIKSRSFASQLKRLLSLKNVSSEFLKVVPGKALVAGEDPPEYWARVDEDVLLIFFAHPMSQDLRLPLRFGQSFTDMDLNRDVTITTGDRSISLKLFFKPYQSLLVKLRPSGPPEFIDISYHPPPAVPY